MNRRSFLAWLGGTAAGVAIAPTLDLERLLWIPGERTIFIPELVAPLAFHPRAFAFTMAPLNLGGPIVWKLGSNPRVRWSS